jgi:ribose transport system permease protein
MSVPVAIGLVLVIGALLGMIHGLFITKANLQPFVVTLCGLLIYRGFARWLVDDQVQGFGNEYENSLGILANGKLVMLSSPDGTPVFGIPYMFFIMVVTAVVAAIFLNWTIWGRYIRALGRNEEAARYSGINTHRMIILAYMICTVLAAVGGMLFAVDSNSISPSGFGNFYELYAIAAAVLGGCSLRGGEGGIFGVVIGTAVMQLLKNLIVLKHINQTLEFVIIGFVLLIGVTADELIRRLVAYRRSVQQARRLVKQQPPQDADTS